MLAVVALLPLAAPRTARGDEFKLKDGSTIVGTVVGYQGDSFKVKTSYGYALVEKDKIVSIKIAATPESVAEKKPKADAVKPQATDMPAAKAAHDAVARPNARPEVAIAKSSPAATKPPASVATNSAAAAPPVTPAPAAPPQPEPIREKISGNTYINDTYQFEMYKPPDWEVMDGARSVLPGAIAAMGTDDQSTYLVVGLEAAGKSPAEEIATTEKRLSDILVNFRPLGDEHLTVSGEPVVARRFRGNVDEYDWSGFMVFLPRGEKLYTIFGMTRADNDLVQIQENVIRRTIASFQFLPQ